MLRIRPLDSLLQTTIRAVAPDRSPPKKFSRETIALPATWRAPLVISYCFGNQPPADTEKGNNT